MSEPHEMPDASSLADLLTQFAEARGFSQSQLAAEAGISKATLHRWLHGKSTSPYHRAGLLRVAIALELRALDANRLLRAAGLPSLKEIAGSPSSEEQPLLAHWMTPVRNNLPADLTSFVGRSPEIRDVAERVGRQSIRLLTLTGVGGSGKTRLALRAAESALDSFPDGVFFVSLAATSDPRLIVPTVAEAVGVRDVPDTSLLTRLTDWLRTRTVLLLLDNLEQLVDSGHIITDLLRTSPGLTVLATSRTPLHVSGEHEWPVQPFPTPDSSQSRRELRENPAVELFIQRAEAANPRYIYDHHDLPFIAEICARVDGLPLAIELAAARVRDHRPQSLLAGFPRRLDLASNGPRDAAVRQQTMRDTIAWSVELLSEPARRLLFRLSIFVGGWSTAATAICTGDGLSESDIDQALKTLKDANLIQGSTTPQGTIRYHMLETIREYGLECLADAGEEAKLRDRHSDYFIRIAESAPPYVPEARKDDWYARVDADMDNFRAALTWLESDEDVARLARMVSALYPYWHEYMGAGEGRRWLDVVLPHRQNLPLPLRARIVTGACVLTSNQTEFDATHQFADEALRLWRELDDHRGQAVILRQLGWSSNFQGFGMGSIEISEAQVDQWRLAGDPHGVAMALSDLATTHCLQGNLAIAAELIAEASELYRQLDDELGLARSLNDQGLHALLRGDVPESIPLLERTVSLLRTAGRNYILPAAVFFLGTAYCFVGRLDEADECYFESLELYEALSDQARLALTILGFAAVAHRRGDFARAAILCGACQAMQQTHDLAFPKTIEEIYQREVALVVDRIGRAAFDRGLAEGSRMSVPEALAYAREARQAR
jgi:predicted ATPase/DNA-binding phage protein